ncbi:hypothetical protein GCM10010521_55780 [Streptomyces rameus]|uniref:Uncharacterized protein n=1 Tax=Streptomyces rameus TaxID=68261 RepID=A0ABN3V2D2_9ACTN
MLWKAAVPLPRSGPDTHDANGHRHIAYGSPTDPPDRPARLTDSPAGRAGRGCRTVSPGGRPGFRSGSVRVRGRAQPTESSSGAMA